MRHGTLTEFMTIDEEIRYWNAQAILTFEMIQQQLLSLLNSAFTVLTKMCQDFIPECIRPRRKFGYTRTATRF